MRSEFLVRQDISRGSVARVEALLSQIRQSDVVRSALEDLGLYAVTASVGRSSTGAYLLYEVEASSEVDPTAVYDAAIAAAADAPTDVSEAIREFDAVTEGPPYQADFGEFGLGVTSSATPEAGD